YGGDELGHHHVGAEAAAQQPEWRFRHARNRREEQRERVSRAIREVHGSQRNDALREEQPLITFRRRSRTGDRTCACASSFPKTRSTCCCRAAPRTTSCGNWSAFSVSTTRPSRRS